MCGEEGASTVEWVIITGFLIVLAAVVVTAIISVLLYLSTYLIERAVIPWHIKERKAERA